MLIARIFLPVDARAFYLSNMRTNAVAWVLWLTRSLFWELKVKFHSKSLKFLDLLVCKGEKKNLLLPTFCFQFPSQKRTLWMCGAMVKKWKQRVSL